MVGNFLNFCPEFCFVIEDGWDIVGYVLAAENAKEFMKQTEVAWIPSMMEKYPRPEMCKSEAEVKFSHIFNI